MGGAAEDATLKQSSEIDGHSFQWMVASLDEDHELEQFFAGIPGFFKSMLLEMHLGPARCHQVLCLNW